MSCPQENLKDYLLGELAESDREKLEAHLEACPACRTELGRLRLAVSAVKNLPEEEIPYRIAFVSDKIFEPGFWRRLWSSGPRLGFASAALLAAAIIIHGWLVRPAGPSTGELAAMEARIQQEVARRLEAELVPVIESLQMMQKRANLYYRASLEVEGRP